MKKTIGIMLAVAMTAGVLAGCSGNQASSPKETVAKTKAETQAAAGAEKKEEAKEEAASGEASAAKPENYPKKPIEILVPYAAGGAADLAARAIASVLPDYLDGATVTITNVTGGNGVVGISQLMNAKNDGYTLAAYASPLFEITPYMNDVAYTMDDFTFLGTTVQRPNVLVVNSKSGWNTLDDFVKHAKENPGTTYGDPAAGSAHLGFETLIKKAELTDMKFVPYSGGSGEAITALLGQHIDSVIALPADTFEYIKSGDLKALCIEGEERIDIMPDVPTAKELGYDVVVGLTNGFVAPAGLDSRIAEYLSAALEKAVQDPRVLDLDPGDEGLLVYYNGQETKELLKSTATSFEPIIKELGLSK